MQTELLEKQRKAEELSQLLSDKEQQLSDSQKRIVDLESHIKSLEESSLRTRETVAQLEAKIKEQQEELQQYVTQLADVKTKNIDLSNALLQKEANEQMLQRASKEQEAAYEEKMNRLLENIQKEKSHTDEAEVYKRKSEALQEKLDSELLSKEASTMEYLKRLEEMQELQRQLTEAKERIGLEHSERESLKEMETTIVDLRGKLEATSEEKNASQARLEEVLAENAKLQQQVIFEFISRQRLKII